LLWMIGCEGKGSSIRQITNSYDWLASSVWHGMACDVRASASMNE